MKPPIFGLQISDESNCPALNQLQHSPVGRLLQVYAVLRELLRRLSLKQSGRKVFQGDVLGVPWACYVSRALGFGWVHLSVARIWGFLREEPLSPAPQHQCHAGDARKHHGLGFRARLARRSNANLNIGNQESMCVYICIYIYMHICM